MIRFLAALSAFVLAISPAAAQKSSIQLEDTSAINLSPEVFAASPTLDQPDLSPDGKFIAAKKSVNGDTRLVIWPLDDPSAKPVVQTFGGGDVDLDYWLWLNDEWVLAYVSSSKRVDGEDYRLSRIMTIHRTSGKVNRIAWDIAAQDGAKVIWTSYDNSPRLLLGVRRSFKKSNPGYWTEVLSVDGSTGAYTTLLKPWAGVTDYYADPKGVVRVAYRYEDKTRIAQLFHRKSNSAPFEEIDRANTQLNENLTVPKIFGATPEKAIALISPDGFDAYYEYDLGTMTRGKKLFGVTGYDVEGAVTTRDGTAISGVYFTDKRFRLAWLDAGLAAIQKNLDATFGAGRARVTSWNEERTLMLVRVGDADQAGAYYIVDTKNGGVPKLLGYNQDAFGLRRLSPVTTIKYSARDGLPIEAVLTLPKGKTAKNLPLIVLPHGGPEARDEEAWDWWVQFLAWRGYAVIQPNYRGSTGYGNQHYGAGVGEWGMKMQDDLLDAIDHLAKKGIADPKRVCIVGASYGGYAAMRGAQRDGKFYRCAISYAGVSDISGMGKFDAKFLNGATILDSWKKTATDINSVSPAFGAPAFGAPILLMHGKNDLRVPVKQSRIMAERLKAAGKTHRYVEQPLGDHYFTRVADRLEFLKEMDAFLKLYNPA